MVPATRAPLRVDRLRALNTPQPVEVGLDARGRPVAIRRRHDGIPASPNPVPRHDGMDDTSGRVEAVGEIWRVDDEWWRQPVSRRYVEVVLEGGKHVVLFEDLMTGRWWLQQP